MKVPYKLGSRYTIGAYKTALVSFFAWLLWMFLVDGLDYSVSAFQNYNSEGFFQTDDWLRKRLGDIYPTESQFRIRSFCLATIMTLWVIYISPLFGIRIRNRIFRVRAYLACLFQRRLIQLGAKLPKRDESKDVYYPYGDPNSDPDSSSESKIGLFMERWYMRLFGWHWLPGTILVLLMIGLVVFALLSVFSLIWLTAATVMVFLASLAGWIMTPVFLPIMVTFEVGMKTVGNLTNQETVPWLEYLAVLFPAFWLFVQYWFGSRIFLNGWFALYSWGTSLSETSLLRKIIFMGKGPSARWAGPRTYSKMKKSPGGTALFLGTTDILDVGPKFGELIYNDDDAHMITIGLAGSGKSVSCIWPSIATYEGSLLIYDPVGEHARETFWRRNSSAEWYRNSKFTERCMNFGESEKDDPLCFKLDPLGFEKSIPGCCYNPLDEISLDDPNAEQMIFGIASACVIVTGQEKDPYWTDTARKVIAGFIAYVVETQPQENRNLPYIHDLLVQFDPKYGLVEDPYRRDKVLEEMQTLVGFGNIAAIGAKALLEVSESQFQGVLGSIINSVAWMGSKHMRGHLSGKSAFSFKDLRKETPRSVYVVMEVENLEEYGRWLRVLTNLSLLVMQRTKERSPVLVVLDEFSKLGGQIPAITKGITTFRKKRIKLWMFVQNKSQFSEYKNSDEFFENSTIQVVGVQGGASDTAKWVSEMLGERAHEDVYTKMDSRKMLTPQQVNELLSQMSPNQIVFPVKEGLPMRLRRLAHTKIKGRMKGHPFLKGCFESRSKG